MSLPKTNKERKQLPIFRGPLMYFPDALLEVARLCKIGNDQHNPGKPMHWARGKSMEQMDTALRHMMDHGMGQTLDTDGVYHMAKAAWRCLAELQLAIERDRAEADKLTRECLEFPDGPHDDVPRPVSAPVATTPREPKVGDRVRVLATCVEGSQYPDKVGEDAELIRIDAGKDGFDLPFLVRYKDRNFDYVRRVEIVGNATKTPRHKVNPVTAGLKFKQGGDA